MFFWVERCQVTSGFMRLTATISIHCVDFFDAFKTFFSVGWVTGTAFLFSCPWFSFGSSILVGLPVSVCCYVSVVSFSSLWHSQQMWPTSPHSKHLGFLPSRNIFSFSSPTCRDSGISKIVAGSACIVKLTVWPSQCLPFSTLLWIIWTPPSQPCRGRPSAGYLEILRSVWELHLQFQ